MSRQSSALLMLLAALALPAHAQSNGDVTSALTVSRVVVKPDGKETIEPATAAKPGDVLEYVAEYRNGGKSAVKKLEATLPIPSGTEYLPDSAKPAGVRASLDGSAFELTPLKRRVKQANGSVVEQLVPYAEYRFLRWPPQDLAAGRSMKYSARVKLSAEGLSPPSAAPGR